MTMLNNQRVKEKNGIPKKRERSQASSSLAHNFARVLPESDANSHQDGSVMSNGFDEFPPRSVVTQIMILIDSH